MSARYTSGKRYGEVAMERRSAASQGDDSAAQACLQLGEADAIAYAKVQELRKAKAPAEDIALAELAARQVPYRLRQLHSKPWTSAFQIPLQPWLLSDLRAAAHLMAGAGAAAQNAGRGDPPQLPNAAGFQLCNELTMAKA